MQGPGRLWFKYVRIRPAKHRGNDTVPRNKFDRRQENNATVNSAVDEILLHENEKLSAVKEAPETFNSNFDENKLYHIDNISLEETK